MAGGQGVPKVDFSAPFGPASNVPIGTNRHVQKGSFGRGAHMYSEGLHRDQQSLAVTDVSLVSNLVDPDGVLLSILRPLAKRRPFEHADWYQLACSKGALLAEGHAELRGTPLR